MQKHLLDFEGELSVSAVIDQMQCYKTSLKVVPILLIS